MDRDMAYVGGTETAGVWRDARVLLVFSTAVNPRSVDRETVRIRYRNGAGEWEDALGRFEAVPDRRNQIVFDPTVIGADAPNPLGLPAETRIEVVLPDSRRRRCLRSRDGLPLGASIRTWFETGSGYRDEGRPPEVVETPPEDGDVYRSTSAEVTIRLSVPVDPSSVVLGETFRVRNLTDNVDVEGELTFSTDLTTLTFRPSRPYGEARDIFVGVTTGVTNLVRFPLRPLPRRVGGQPRNRRVPDRGRSDHPLRVPLKPSARGRSTP